MVTQNTGGTADVITSVPCAAGASNEICMVEVGEAFYFWSEVEGSFRQVGLTQMFPTVPRL